MPTSKQSETIIDNFLAMTPEAPEFSKNNKNYLIAGANPTYYLDNPGTEEQQNAPLAASLNWVKVAGVTLDGNIIAMYGGGTGGTTFSAFIMTSTSQVYGINVSGGVPVSVTSLGYPSGSPVTATHGDFTVINGYLYAGYNLMSNSYKMNNFTTPNWTTLPIAFGLNSFFINFNKYTMTSYYNTVTPTDSSFTSYTPLNIGNSGEVLGMVNYNDKYLAIAGVLSGFIDYTQNYIFLWDGISPTYNFSVKVPGTFFGMKVISGVLNVVVQLSSGKTAVYILDGINLKQSFLSPYSNIDTFGFTGLQVIDTANIFDFKGDVGVRLASNGTLTSPIMISGNPPAGESKFILSSGNAFSRFTTGIDGLLYAAEYIPGGADNIWFYPVTGNSYQPITYLSSWMPSQSAASLEIVYNSPPQSVTDAINVTVYGVGEDILSGSSTTVLAPITSTSYLTANKTRLDLQGFVGDKMKVQINTVNNGTWRPIIRAIRLIAA
jgi:hypothetical protein